jgi:hypothetical protein
MPATATWTKSETPATASVTESDPAASLQGAAVDRGAFRIVRAIPKAPAGLTVLVLDADVLARSRALEDVRLVSAADRQVPYVVEKRDEPLLVPLPLTSAKGERGTSVYRIEMPYPTLPYGTRLVLRTSARVFERTIELRRAAEKQRGRTPATITTTIWRAADPELLPPAMTFDPPLSGNDVLEVVVHEGDNAPLPLTRAELLLPSVALRFHHPGTEIFLLYGNREVAAPRYDLALLAPRLFAQPARELTLVPAGTRVDEPADQGARKFFWIAIGGAALVLLLLLAKLLRPLISASG